MELKMERIQEWLVWCDPSPSQTQADLRERFIQLLVEKQAHSPPGLSIDLVGTYAISVVMLEPSSDTEMCQFVCSSMLKLIQALFGKEPVRMNANAFMEFFQDIETTHSSYSLPIVSFVENILTTEPLPDARKFARMLSLLLGSRFVNFCSNKKAKLPNILVEPWSEMSNVVFSGPSEYRQTAGLTSSLDFLCSQVSECLRLTKEKDTVYYANYTTLCQASGYGKTRLVKECAGRHVLVYMCLRRSRSSGWPSRSPVIADYVQRGISSKEQWRCLIDAVLLCLNEDESVGAPRYDATVAPESNTKALEAWGKQFVSNRDADKVFQESFWKAVLRYMEAIIMTLNNKQRQPSGSTALQKRKLADWFATGRAVLFCVDEAAVLLQSPSDIYLGRDNSSVADTDKTSLGALRSALADVSRIHQSVFTLFLDTNSTICNFQPTQIYDPSERVRVQGHKLFPPFYFFPMVIDNFLTEDQAAKFPAFILSMPTEGISATNISCVSVVWRPLSMLTLARPVFCCRALGLNLIDPNDEEVFARWLLEECVRFAADKLTSATSSNESVSPNLPCLAVVASRLHVFNMTHMAKLQLVKLHMATCSVVSADRSDITVRYPSEPCLVAGAMYATAFRKYDFGTLLRSLEAMLIHRSLLSFNGGIGEMGEFIAQLVLIKAMDSATFSSCSASASSNEVFIRRYGVADAPARKLQHDSSFLKVGWRPLPLLWFLQQLYNSQDYSSICSYLHTDEVLSRLLSAVMFSTHFVTVSYEPSSEDLLKFWRQGAGIKCQHDEVGVDIIIPLLLPTKAGLAVDIEDGDTFTASALLIQIKNRLRNESLVLQLNKAEQHGLWSHFARNDTPFIFMAWNIKPTGTRQASVLSSSILDGGRRRKRSRDASGTPPVARALVLTKIGLNDFSNDDLPCLTVEQSDIVRKLRGTMIGGDHTAVADSLAQQTGRSAEQCSRMADNLFRLTVRSSLADAVADSQVEEEDSEDGGG